MQLSHAEFMLGAVAPQQFPKEGLPEIAFAGRSNAGKSTLLNRLLNRKRLARVSRTPGCTREINFFLVDGQWILADLPGYGFAKVPGSQRESWNQVLDLYFAKRRELRAVILLLDIRRGVTELDQRMLTLLGQSGLPYLPVASKTDKLASNPRRAALQEMTRHLSAFRGNLLAAPLACSSLSGEGFQELRHHVMQILSPAAHQEGPCPPD
ncbi:MAG: YihA family ribosome biogenesis GTP-binding protein [Magnetococcales bacterium]|nr:YihA family ribosome biogenesis GTP-binding protein [Magnetococcales bacterium]